MVLFVLLAIDFWRRATDLQGHARAGAEVIVAALSRQMAPTSSKAVRRPTLQEVLPGFGDPVAVPIAAESAAAGKSLAELELRGATGATIVAIIRGEERIFMPSGSERIRAGDVLAVTGTHESVDAARELL
jgi:CPA2 family monovalent cation:H+ antiporter-2